jgi:hypothetical protein
MIEGKSGLLPGNTPGLRSSQPLAGGFAIPTDWQIEE